MIPPYVPSQKSQTALIEFYKQCTKVSHDQWSMRTRMEEIDRQYSREVDLTEDQYKAKHANKQGDADKFQNITLPVIMPQVEAALTYQQSVFLTGYPIFGVTASPEHADAAMMMDTIIGEQQVRGKWVNELQKVIRNGLKYNLAFCEVDWAREVTYSIETDTSTENIGRGRGTELIWEGNKLKALDMYNTFWDTRCKPEDIPQHGEFIGYTELMSRIRLKQYINSLPTKINVREAFESGFTGANAGGSAGTWGYHIPRINPEALIDMNHSATTDWMTWAGFNTKDTSIRYGNMYQVTHLYGRILPSDFSMKGIPGQNTPQIWKFILVNDDVLIYAERMTNVHQMLPVLPYQPYDDGLGYQTKSLAKNLEPIQSITSALSNSTIASRRRAISDRMIYDPSRISPAAINNDSPNAKIPVRPSAYQDDLSRAVYQIPFRDDQSAVNMQEIGFYTGYANQISGLNPARQGQFVKGNKTRHEFAEIMGYANGRDQAIAIATEASFFTPLKEIIKVNILQYQGSSRVYNREEQVSVSVDPVLLRKAVLEFKVSDGQTPSEKLIDGESMALAMQTMASNQQIGAGFNVVPMFSYLMKMRGAKLQPFEKSPEQMAYEQALASWQQAAMMIQEAAKHTEPPMSPEELQQLIQQNPQPIPEQFGYDPAKPQLSQTSPLTPGVPSILENLQSTTGAGSQQASPGAGGTENQMTLP